MKKKKLKLNGCHGLGEEEGKGTKNCAVVPFGMTEWLGILIAVVTLTVFAQNRTARMHFTVH